MSTESTTNEPITVINVITVRADEQDALVERIHDNAYQVLSAQPGFISCMVYKSIDKRRVVIMGRWQSNAHFDAMFHQPDAVARLREVTTMNPTDWHVYELAFLKTAQ